MSRHPTEAAIERVEAAALESWLRLARRAVLFVARRAAYRNDDFTTEEVWRALATHPDGEPAERRALGAVMRTLKREGLIVATGLYRLASNPESHSRPLTVWFSPLGAGLLRAHDTPRVHNTPRWTDEAL